jgi:predicted nucleic acid-binding protein
VGAVEQEVRLVITAYLDASVLLRIILREEHPLDEWDDLELGVASPILQVECLRTLHRLWLHRQLDTVEYEEKVSRATTMIRYLDLIALDDDVIAGAKGPLPVALTSLDAIHLASAMVYRKAQPSDERPIYFATHDVALARAAKAMHFDVIGVTV